jgi:protein SCO1/2
MRCLLPIAGVRLWISDYVIMVGVRFEIVRRLRGVSVAAVAVALLAAGGLSGCGSSAAASHASTSAGNRAKGNGLEGLILEALKPAPPLALHNYTGQPVSLATMRGKAVLVTFVYTHCPDVCPLIVRGLAAAQRQLGSEARRLRILAVTVDPRRDTPSAIREFLRARGALGRIGYLLGTRSQLLRTWKAWDIGVTQNNKVLTIGHTAIVYGITASGRMAVVYPSDFTPAQIIHDVPLLARM